MSLSWNGFNKFKRRIFKLSNDISHSSWVKFRAKLLRNGVVVVLQLSQAKIFSLYIFSKKINLKLYFLVFLCTYVQNWIQLCHNLCQKLLHCMEPYTYSPLKINLLTGNNGTTTINYTKKRVWCLLTMTNYFVKV